MLNQPETNGQLTNSSTEHAVRWSKDNNVVRPGWDESADAR